ncbi:MAG: hypothetical protein DWH84_03470 [Planctomycetota bacterium]|nr:MAG: hypothetical protein DWH84_03470 [Planctomycetota bacterium]
MSTQLEVLQPGPRCSSLLSKGLYINAGLPKGKEVTGDGNFWCGKTQKIYGPDDRICDGDRCTDATRSCYEE